MMEYGLNKLYKNMNDWDEPQNLKNISEVEIIREILDYVRKINEKKHYLVPQPDVIRERCDLDMFSIKVMDAHDNNLSRFSEKFKEAFTQTYGYLAPQPINNKMEK